MRGLISIPAALQKRLNELLELEGDQNSLKFEFSVHQSSRTRIQDPQTYYTASIGGWLYPYEYKHPNRLFVYAKSASLDSLEQAISRVLDTSEAQIRIAREHPETVRQGQIALGAVCEAVGHQISFARELPGKEYCDRCHKWIEK